MTRLEAPVPSGFFPCPLCQVQVQRMPDGNLQDGLRAHYKTVHPAMRVPLINPRSTGRPAS